MRLVLTLASLLLLASGCHEVIPIEATLARQASGFVVEVETTPGATVSVGTGAGVVADGSGHAELVVDPSSDSSCSQRRLSVQARTEAFATEGFGATSVDVPVPLCRLGSLPSGPTLVVIDGEASVLASDVLIAEASPREVRLAPTDDGALPVTVAAGAGCEVQLAGRDVPVDDYGLGTAQLDAGPLALGLRSDATSDGGFALTVSATLTCDGEEHPQTLTLRGEGSPQWLRAQLPSALEAAAEGASPERTAEAIIWSRVDGMTWLGPAATYGEAKYWVRETGEREPGRTCSYNEVGSGAQSELTIVRVHRRVEVLDLQAGRPIAERRFEAPDECPLVASQTAESHVPAADIQAFLASETGVGR